MIPGNSTYTRPPLYFRHDDDKREKELHPDELRHVRINSDILARLRSQIASDAGEALLRYFFQERKFDARVQDYVTIIRGFFVRAVAGKDDEALPESERVGFKAEKLSEEQFQNFGKLLVTFETIVTLCQSNQKFLELINSARIYSGRFLDIIILALSASEEDPDKIIDHVNKGVKKLIDRQESEKKLAATSVRHELPSFEESVSATKAETPANDPNCNVLLFIKENYECEITTNKFGILQLDSKEPTRKKTLTSLIESVLGLSDFEGEIIRKKPGLVMTEGGFDCTLTIENPACFYVCLDRISGDKVVKTTNNYLNLIYQIAVIKAEIGEDITYQDLATEALDRFTPLHPTIHSELETQLRNPFYESHFLETFGCQRGFNFDYCFNDLTLHDTLKLFLANHDTDIESAMALIAYGDAIITGKGPDEGDMLVRSLSNERVCLHLSTPISPGADGEEVYIVNEKFANFPGIGLIEQIDPRDGSRTISFVIIDPILARNSTGLLMQSILMLHQECGQKILEAASQGAKRIMDSLTKSLSNPRGRKIEFVTDPKVFLRSTTTPDGNQSIKFNDSVTTFPKENDALITFLVANNHRFTALSFERKTPGPVLRMVQKFTPALQNDAAELSALLAQHLEDSIKAKKEQEAAYSELLAEAEAEARKAKEAEAKKKQKTGAAAQAAKKSSAKSAAAPLPKAAAAPPPADSSKQWKKFDEFLTSNKQKLLAQLAAEDLEIVKSDERILINFTNIDPSNWLALSLCRQSHPAQYEIRFDEAESAKFSLSFKLGKDVPTSLGTLRSFLDKEIVQARKPQAARAAKVAPAPTQSKTSAPTHSSTAKPLMATPPAVEEVVATTYSVAATAPAEEPLIAATPPTQIATESVSASAVVVVDAITKAADEAEEDLVPVALAAAASTQDAPALEETAATAELNAQTKEFLRTRGDYLAFTQYFSTILPAPINNVAQAFRADPNILQFAIYGSFMFSQKPNDLDLQVVVRDEFIAEKTDEEMQEFLGELFPGVRVGIEKHINPRSRRAVWKVEAGDLVELTFVENRDHIINQNWVSNIDAAVFDLKSETFMPQPSFVAAMQEITGFHFGTVALPNIVNYRAKNWPLRLIHQIRPALLTTQYTTLAANYFMDKFSMPDAEITFGATPKTFAQKLEERAEEFAKKHKMDSVELDIFHRNLEQICDMARRIETLKAAASASSRGEGEGRSSIAEKSPTKAPQPGKGGAFRVAKVRAKGAKFD